MSQPKALNVFRPSINELELASLIYDLEMTATTRKLEPATALALGKLKMLAMKHNLGLSKPSYVQTGRDHVVSIEKLTQLDPSFERRNANTVTYTPEEKTEAEFKAADHFIATGEYKDWKEFLDKTTISVGISESSELSESLDLALFKSLGG